MHFLEERTIQTMEEGNEPSSKGFPAFELPQTKLPLSQLPFTASSFQSAMNQRLLRDLVGRRSRLANFDHVTTEKVLKQVWEH